MTFTQRLQLLREKHPNESRKRLIMAVRFAMGLESVDDISVHHCFPQPCYKHYDAPPLLSFEDAKFICTQSEHCRDRVA